MLVTTVVPTGKVEPLGDGSTLVSVQLSEAVMLHVTLPLLHCPASALKVIFAGTTVKYGGVRCRNDRLRAVGPRTQLPVTV